jgi:hypothetical protein
MGEGQGGDDLVRAVREPPLRPLPPTPSHQGRGSKRFWIYERYLRDRILEAMAKPVFIVILNEVKDLKLLKMPDSSLRSE